MSTKIMRPMLAAKAGDLNKLRFPVFATPKIDGIRCLTLNPGVLQFQSQQCSPVSRRLLPIKNQHIWRQLAEQCIPGLDGELVTGVTTGDKFKAHNFNEVSSEVSSHAGFPDFRYIVFDYGHDIILETGIQKAHNLRLNFLASLNLPDFCVVLHPMAIFTLEQLLAYEEAMLFEGYEGVMIRTFDSPYKFGRSTLNEQWLVKIKRFQDAEAEVIDAEELMHNDNPQEQSATGYAERSTHAENMRPGGVLGKFVVRGLNGPFKGREFRIGTGFNAEQRSRFWAFRSTYVGAVMKYRYQPHGSLVSPRIPVFLGWRDGGDM